jgi:hypothetical protein
MIKIDLKKFNREFDKAVKQSEEATEKSVRAAAIQTFSDIILATPVGNPTYWAEESRPAPPGYTGGSLRGNWQTTLKQPAFSEIDRKQSNSNGGATAETLTGTNGYNLNTNIYLTNNLPYAERINGGYSVQPGVEIKFVEKNANKFEATLNKIIARNKI